MRDQPLEVSRLPHLQPTSPGGHKVAARGKEIVELARSAGFTNVRVFGSVARGDDGAASDLGLSRTEQDRGESTP